jgi:mannose/cellobiose epimerase-like protein (N-acyl-D-glucosamine 2-epimerase family)
MDTAKIRHWLFDEALPFWATSGLDTDFGGPLEALNLQGTGSANITFKRTRVAARQLYVYSQASLLGWSDGRAVADTMFEHLMSRCWTGMDTGWVKRIAPDGSIIDPTPDLYDYAFMLFALGWYYRATKNALALSMAHKTLDIVEAKFRHPLGGFEHELPASLPRLQNPHMHMLEAMLALVDATDGDGRFVDLSNELRDLFAHRLFSSATGVLPEFFDANLVAVAGERGRIVEPGHHMEWAWILGQHQRQTGQDNTGLISSLMTFAEENGVDAHTGLTRNMVRDDGLILDGGSRTWPNTERIKGWLAWQEFGGKDARSAVTQTVETLFARHLNHPVAGCWYDAFDAAGACTAVDIPTSTLYHVYLCFVEILRVYGDRSGVGDATFA